MNKKRLIIFPNGFPYGGEESSFLMPEITQLLKHFEIIIVSPGKPEKGMVKLPEEIQIINYKRRPSSLLELIEILFKAVFNHFFIEELIVILKQQKYVIKRIIMTLRESYLAQGLTKTIKNHMNLFDTNNKIILYSYWYCFGFLPYPLICKELKNKNIKYITRTHGYDLFDHRNDAAFQPYKMQMDNMLDRIVFCAKQGCDYYLERYEKRMSDKYVISMLGVKKQDFLPIPENGNKLKMLSLSNIVPVKRLEYIIEALYLIDSFNIEWTHIGGSSEMDTYAESVFQLAKKLDQKPNIQYKFLGALSNDKAMENIMLSEYDFFTHASMSEGLPFSIQEAMSFGLPIIATDAGGTAEAVNNENGTLLSVEISPIDLANAYSDFALLNTDQRMKKRRASYATWERFFNAEKNHAAFAQMLNEIE